MKAQRFIWLVTLTMLCACGQVATDNGPKKEDVGAASDTQVGGDPFTGAILDGERNSKDVDIDRPTWRSK